MAKKRDMIDDIIDIQRDWQAVSNPLGNIAGTLAQDPNEVKVFNPADYKSRPRSNSIFCARVSSENHDVCSKCLDVCPVDAITIEGASVKVSDDCRKCGLCTAVCPTEVFLVQKIMANSLYDQIGRIANAYEQCYVTCTRAMGRLHRMPKENEVVLPCVGAISRELWFSLLADFGNVSVYLPLGICDKCRTTTGEEFLSEQIAQAEEWAERGAGLEVEDSELDHELSRAFKRSQFMGSVARAGQTLVAASNPALGGAAAIAKKLQEHSERVFDMQRALEQTAGEKTTSRRSSSAPSSPRTSSSRCPPVTPRDAPCAASASTPARSMPATSTAAGASRSRRPTASTAARVPLPAPRTRSRCARATLPSS